MLTQNINKAKQIVLLIGDILVFYLSLYVTLIVRYGRDFNIDLWKSHIGPFSIVFVVWFLVFYINDLYDLKIAKNNIKLYGFILRSLVINLVLAIAFFYFTSGRFINLKPQTVLLYYVVIFTVLFYTYRQIYNRFLQSPTLAENILFIGFNNEVQELIDEIQHKSQLGYAIKILINYPPTTYPTLNNITILDNFSNLKGIIAANNINIIVVAHNHRDDAKLTQELYDCLNEDVSFYNLPKFYEMITGKIPVNTIDQAWFLENLNQRKNLSYEIIKKISDVIMAIILSILTLPILPFVYLTIKLGSSGSAFFTQRRVGKNGKTFLAIKFRSMYGNAEKNGPQWAQKNDPRVTPFGKFMRQTRLDEIPQLINVLRGEMSFVGPRPERPEFVAELSQKIPFYKERLMVKPGLTGWAQINFPYGASAEDALKKLQYDLFYIKNHGFMMDSSILLKTVKTVLSGGGQ